MSEQDRRLEWERKKTKFAWAKYYQACSHQLQQSLDFVNPLRQQINNNELPTHLINEFKELIDKYKHKYQCSICLDDMSKPTLQVVKCGHFFHKDCITAWLNHHDTCPLCRKKIK